VGNGNVILRELSPPRSYPPQQAPIPHPTSLPISPHGSSGHWVSPGPPPVMESGVSVLQSQRKSLLQVLNKCRLHFGFEIFVNGNEFMEI